MKRRKEGRKKVDPFRIESLCVLFFRKKIKHAMAVPPPSRQ